MFRPGNINATSYHYTLDGLDDDSSYDFFMEAFNSVGVGPNTTVYTVQTDEGQLSFLICIYVATHINNITKPLAKYYFVTLQMAPHA